MVPSGNSRNFDRYRPILPVSSDTSFFWVYRPVTGGPRADRLSDLYVPPVSGGTIRYDRHWRHQLNQVCAYKSILHTFGSESTHLLTCIINQIFIQPIPPHGQRPSSTLMFITVHYVTHPFLQSNLSSIILTSRIVSILNSNSMI